MAHLLWLIPLVLVVVLAWLFVRRRRAMAAAAEENLVAFVWFLKRPRDVDLKTVAAAARRAFPENPPQVLPGPPNPGATMIAVAFDEFVIGVICVAGLYMDDPGADAANIPDFRVKMAIQDHTAWLSVDLFGDLPSGGYDEVYRAIGRLMAELAGDDCLALFSTATDQAVAYGEDLLPLLRSDDPLAAFAVEREDKVTFVPDEHAGAMEKAVEEARRRWPEFVEAFKRRRPDQSFAVKVPFDAGGGGGGGGGEDDEQEFMWVEVDEVAPDGATVKGRLSNDPQIVKGMKIHDPVTVTTADLNDWLYTDARNRFGGFTIPVLQRLQ